MDECMSGLVGAGSWDLCFLVEGHGCVCARAGWLSVSNG